MKLAVFVSVLFFAGAAAAQQPSSGWSHETVQDPLHALVVERFVLEGKYLTPPKNPQDGFVPALVVECSQGKVQHNYFSVGAVLNERSDGVFPVMMEARFDGKATTIAGDALSTDGTAVYFIRVDLVRTLKARNIIIGASEFLGPQIVMQFEIPDSSEILSACSADRILKRGMK